MKITENVSRLTSRESNVGPPEYESGVITITFHVRQENVYT